MGLRKAYSSFRWRMILPVVVMLWSIIAILMWRQYTIEKQYRRDAIESHINIISSSLLKAHRQGYSNDEIDEFLKSMALFFEDSRYEGVRFTVYTEDEWDRNAVPKLFIGRMIDRATVSLMLGNLPVGSDHMWIDGTTYFGYTKASDDHAPIRIFTIMEPSDTLAESLQVADLKFWILLLVLLAVTTAITYYIISRVTNNVRMLSEFAKAANAEDMEIDDSKFPHNELGDISREIVRLYRERGEALNRSRKEHYIAIHSIEEKARIKRQLTNNINHEIKTPVGVIKGYIDTVISSPDMDEATRGYFLKRASDNVDRLCNLLNDVSTMTRLEEGSGNIPMRTIDFHDLVYGVENDFEKSHLIGDMKFNFEIPLDCEVIGNEGLIISAITNLAKNAALHSQGTHMGLYLISESDKYYTFSFWDNGRGVDPSHIPHLFDRFFRIDNGRSRKTGGTGLGLPIVKSSIEAMGGALSVHNRSVGGLEYVFTLRKSSWSGRKN